METERIAVSEINKTYQGYDIDHKESGVVLWAKNAFKLTSNRATTVHALQDVSFDVRQGEVFGIFGANGAGKTTLIKIMACLLQADGGTGRVLNYDIYRDHKKIRASVSLVAPTADVGTDNNLTVRQNLEFWAVVYDLEEHLRDQRIDELLTFLDLKPYEDFGPMSISAGQWQRLAIARSLNPLSASACGLPGAHLFGGLYPADHPSGLDPMDHLEPTAHLCPARHPPGYDQWGRVWQPNTRKMFLILLAFCVASLAAGIVMLNKALEKAERGNGVGMVV